MKRFIKKLVYRAMARRHYDFYNMLANDYIRMHNELTELDATYGCDPARGKKENEYVNKAYEFKKEALKFAWVLGPTTCKKPTWFDKILVKFYFFEYYEVFMD